MASIEAGQKIFLRPIGNAARRSTEIKEVEVTKVGKKFFEVDNGTYGRFFIDTLMPDPGQHISNYQAHYTKQEILDLNESNDLFHEIRKLFDSYWNSKLTLEQLRQIKAIVTKEQS